MSLQKNATITLRFPVQLPDRMIEKVTIRRALVRDLIENPVRDAADMHGELRLMANLCELNIEDIQQLDAADYDALRAQHMFFRTGKKPDGFDA